MKTIGLIGGMSWESTVTYYQLINEALKAKLGGLHSAKILGCTEIGLLIKPKDSALPVFDTTRIHAEAAATMALDVK